MLRTVFAACLAVSLPLVPSASAGTEDVTGWCTYAGSTTPDGHMQFAFGGYATATTSAGTTPVETVLTCTIESLSQGLPGEAPTLRRSVSAASPGAAVVVADTTPPWPVRPVRVCVSGYAVFNPVTPVLVDIVAQCRSSTV